MKSTMHETPIPQCKPNEREFLLSVAYAMGKSLTEKQIRKAVQLYISGVGARFAILQAIWG